MYLVNSFDTATGQQTLYIGETETINIRTKRFLKDDDWSQIVFFISKDDNLTKAHIKYLEGRLLDIAGQADRATLVNKKSSGAKLPESERADMETFLQKMQQLLPVIGIDALLPTVPTDKAQSPQEILHCIIKEHEARAVLTSNGIVVLAGSQAVLQARDSARQYPWITSRRQALLDKKALIKKGERLVFTKDTEFSSPSAAAAVIYGGTANGLTAWKNAEGKTLKALEAE